ncbi:growth/differentiation factor 10 [Halichoeres trimaculatus]|uniref:growth/differentiation factor 10 n=1 Tax=Halichoeres trimaculatus TaxID=147232 RepID=UPI003D9F45A9
MAALRLRSSHLLFLLLNCFLGAASVRTVEGAQDSAFSDGLDQDMVSQHMFKLYEKSSRESRLREGNTVRSFRAAPGSSDHRTVYHLNLTALQDSEVVLSASFHFLLDRRPHHKAWFCKRFKSPSCRSSAVHPSPSISLLLRAVSAGSEVRPGSTGSPLGNMTFHPHRRGVWQMKDVTQVIKEARDRGHLLVSVELDLGQQYHMKPEGALSAGGLPYLLLYADDQALAEPNSVASSLQRYDPAQEEGESSRSPQALQRPNPGPEPRGRVRRALQRPNPGPETRGRVRRALQRPNPGPEPRGRVRREAPLLSDTVQNNELPEVDYRPEGYRKDALWETTWYLALKPKHKAGKKKKNQEDEGLEKDRRAQDRKDDVDQLSVKKVGDGPAQTVGGGRRQGQRNEGKSGKKLRGSSDPQSPVLSFDEQTMRKAWRRQWADAQQRGCSRRNLRVDFADIGWSEWVIAPKAFDAYYCAGTCGFPMPKVARPSNHATIQSIVRAVGIVPGVPEPCCVPEEMSPLPVLYQDESRNPVLKIYPNMSVQSCSCR